MLPTWNKKQKSIDSLICVDVSFKFLRYLIIKLFTNNKLNPTKIFRYPSDIKGFYKKKGKKSKNWVNIQRVRAKF
jgi:hypothetical protein